MKWYTRFNEKKEITLIAIILLVVIAFGGFLFYSSQPARTQKGTSHNTTSIQALNEGIQLKNLNSQNYTIEGYVVNKNICSCPNGVLCLPCLPEILVSEDKEDTAENSRKIYIHIDNIEDFEIGKKYRFTILLPSDKDKQGFSYERQLIKYELVK